MSTRRDPRRDREIPSVIDWRTCATSAREDAGERAVYASRYLDMGGVGSREQERGDWTVGGSAEPRQGAEMRPSGQTRAGLDGGREHEGQGVRGRERGREACRAGRGSWARLGSSGQETSRAGPRWARGVFEDDGNRGRRCSLRHTGYRPARPRPPPRTHWQLTVLIIRLVRRRDKHVRRSLVVP